MQEDPAYGDHRPRDHGRVDGQVQTGSTSVAVLELPAQVWLVEAGSPTSRCGQIVVLHQSNQAIVPESVLESVPSGLGVRVASTRRRVLVVEPGRRIETLSRGYRRSVRNGLLRAVLLHPIQRQVDDTL